MANNPKNQFVTKDDLREMSSEIRADIKGYQKEMKNYAGLLHEQFSDQVKMIAEQHIDTNRNLTGINRHLGHAGQRLDKLEIKTDMLIETVADIKVDTAIIREELESKADKKEHKKLEHRVAILESRT